MDSGAEKTSLHPFWMQYSRSQPERSRNRYASVAPSAISRNTANSSFTQPRSSRFVYITVDTTMVTTNLQVIYHTVSAQQMTQPDSRQQAYRVQTMTLIRQLKYHLVLWLFYRAGKIPYIKRTNTPRIIRFLYKSF